MGGHDMNAIQRILGKGASSHKLDRMIIMKLIQLTGQDNCFQCGQQIEDVITLSIEHKEPWQGADDPKATFFDLENIAFSHLRCNISANGSSRKTHCPQGHPYDDVNTRVRPRGDGYTRTCRLCELDGNRRRKSISPERWLLDAKGPNRTRCYNGHLQSEDTIYIYPGSGKQTCKVCLREGRKRYQERARQKVLMEV
jgi:hypothetical protein